MAGMRSRLVPLAVVLVVALLWLGGSVGVVKSPLRRTILGLNAAAAPVAYWPLEDPVGSTSAGSGLPGGARIPYGDNPPEPGASGLCDGADAALDVAGTGQSPAAALSLPATDTWSASWVGRYYHDDSFTAARMFTLYGNAGLTIAVQLIGQRIQVAMATDTDSAIVYTDVVAGDADGTADPHHFVLTLTQNSTDIDIELSSDGSVATGGFPGSDSLTGTNGVPSSVVLGSSIGKVDGSRLLMGHLAIYDLAYAVNLNDTPGPVGGHAGETAAARFARICDEEGIPYSIAT